MAGREVREWLGRNRGGLAVGVLGMLAVAGAALFLQRPATPPPVAVLAPTARPSPSPAPVVPIAVHVSGEVQSPGLYRLSPGSRVDDAVQAAGGATGEADLQRLNLAARLADGQQVAVPRKAEPRAAASPGAGTPGLVNINVASAAELDTLPGVGPVTAQRIIAYREQNGPFTSVEQLREARLVNATTFERIRDLVTV